MLLWHVLPPFTNMAVMLQEWKCEVIRDVWLDLLRICMDTCSEESLLSRVGYAVGPKCLRPVVKMLLFCIIF